MSEHFFVPLTPGIEAKVGRDPTDRIVDALDGVVEPQAAAEPAYSLADLTRWLHRLPPLEADVVELRLAGKTELEISRILNMTQAAISYRFQRACRRVRFLDSMPDLSEQEIRTTLAPLLKPRTIEVLVGMFHTSSQSRTAELLGTSQGNVRHRFFTALEQLAQIDDPKVRRCWTFLDGVKRTPNILIECDTSFWRKRRKPPGLGVIDL